MQTNKLGQAIGKIVLVGGLSVGYGINETAIKEAGEKAGIPNHLLKIEKWRLGINVF